MHLSAILKVLLVICLAQASVINKERRDNAVTVTSKSKTSTKATSTLPYPTPKTPLSATSGPVCSVVPVSPSPKNVDCGVEGSVKNPAAFGEAYFPSHDAFNYCRQRCQVLYKDNCLSFSFVASNFTCYLYSKNINSMGFEKGSRGNVFYSSRCFKNKCTRPGRCGDVAPGKVFQLQTTPPFPPVENLAYAHLTVGKAYYVERLLVGGGAPAANISFTDRCDLITETASYGKQFAIVDEISGSGTSEIAPETYSVYENLGYPDQPSDSLYFYGDILLPFLCGVSNGRFSCHDVGNKPMPLYTCPAYDIAPLRFASPTIPDEVDGIKCYELHFTTTAASGPQATGS